MRLCGLYDLKYVWTHLPCCLLKGTVKRHFLDTYPSGSLWVCNTYNTLAMRVTFFRKCSKLHLHFKSTEKDGKNDFRFWDNCIWICAIKLSLWSGEYLSLALNVLTNSHKILLITKNSISLWVINKYDEGAAVMIGNVFQHLYYFACRRVLWNGTF